MDEENVKCTDIEFTLKKEGNPTVSNNMVRPGKHYAK